MIAETAFETHIARSASTKSGSRLPTVARTFMGLVFFVFGLNGFLNFLPAPPPGSLPEGAALLTGAILKSGYMLQLIKGTELTVGVLLLSNRFVPLALALIAPVVVNIVLYHAFLAPSGLVIALVVLSLEVYLAWTQRSAYRPMLAARGAGVA